MPKQNLETLKNKIFFSSYKAESKIGEGSFGKVFSGRNIRTMEKVALKIESKSNTQLFLEQESCILFYLRGGEGIPTFFSYGYSEEYNILIMELLGKSIDKLFEEFHTKFSIKTVCLLALQMLNRLEFLHTNHLIHRDLKPDNFTLGLDENKNTVYLIDFGLTKKYRSSKTLEHIKFCNKHKLTGTARYASINALSGYEQSRKDDMEGLCYVIIYLLKGSLPWQGLKIRKKEERYRKIKELKERISSKELVGIQYPYEFEEFVSYCRGLHFEEDPNYSYLSELIKKIMIKYSFEFDTCFEWNVNSKSSREFKSRIRTMIEDNEKNENFNDTKQTREEDESISIQNNISEHLEPKPLVTPKYKFISTIKNNLKRNLSTRINSTLTPCHNKLLSSMPNPKILGQDDDIKEKTVSSEQICKIF